MSKCISLVGILHDLLKDKDIQVYEKIKARVCEELKWSMERAIDQTDGADGDSFFEGTKMTLRGLRTALESEGVTHIEAMNKQFDPTKMEAVAMLPAPEGVESGFVMEVIEEGYMLHERVLIASKVIVAEMTEE